MCIWRRVGVRGNASILGYGKVLQLTIPTVPVNEKCAGAVAGFMVPSKRDFAI